MDFSNNSLVTLIKQKMAFLSERQSALSQNIANANTPGYKAKDVKAPDFKKLVAGEESSGRLATTHPGHIAGKGGGGSARFKHINQKNTFETTPTGNEVVLDEQMLKMSETAMDYQTTTSVYKKMLDMMRVAVGGGGGS